MTSSGNDWQGCCQIDGDEQDDRYVMVGEAFNDGRTVETLMRSYQGTAGTILNHLTSHGAGGNRLRRGDDLLTLSRHPRSSGKPPLSRSTSWTGS